MHLDERGMSQDLEFAVEVMVDVSTHQERSCREDKTDFYVCWKMTQQSGRKPKVHRARCLHNHSRRQDRDTGNIHRASPYDANTWLKNHSAAYFSGLPQLGGL